MAALDGISDDMPVRAWAAEEPGSEFGPELVIYDGAMGVEWVPPTRGDREGAWVTAPWFDLQCEFPSGTYCRYEDTESSADDD